MDKILVLIGPTSIGKTDLALQLAGKFNGELISCDSRQVYKGLDIGTGKMPSSKFKVQSSKLQKQNGWWKLNGIKIWMLDVADPKKQYTVADYINDAIKVIDAIVKRGKLPILVGGTGFYLKALLEGIPNLGVPADQKLRKQLNNLAIEQLQQRLRCLDGKRWTNMNNSDRRNPRRLIRAIELTMVKPNRKTPNHKSRITDYFILKVGLTAPRDVLYQRIDERVVSRVNQGMIEEAKRLKACGLTLKRMKQLGLEYGVLADYLTGDIKNKEELIKTIQGKIHDFARRQLTWYKKEKNINWFDITDKDYMSKVEKLITRWYDLSYAATN